MWFLSARLETLPRTHIHIYRTRTRTRTRYRGSRQTPKLYHVHVCARSPVLGSPLLPSWELSLDQWRYRSLLGNSSADSVTVFCSLLFQWLLLPLFRSRFRRFTFLSSSGSECRSVFCPVGSSARFSSALSSGSEVSISSALMSSALQISVPAAVNPSAWDFVGMELGKRWDVLGLALLSSYIQSEVDHLSNFQSEVDHGLKN